MLDVIKAYVPNLSAHRRERRILFVCQHPTLGQVILNRSVFVRRWRRPLDECPAKLHRGEAAKAALTEVYGFAFKDIHRRGMFEQKGLSYSILELTVFEFGAEAQHVLDELPKEHYTKLSEHRLSSAITRALLPL